VGARRTSERIASPAVPIRRPSRSSLALRLPPDRPVVTALVPFAVVVVVAFVVALLQGDKPFYYDASGYWGLAQSFVKDGTFSLLNFDNAIRGYLLPLVNHGVQEVGNALSLSEYVQAKLLNAVVVAVVTTILAPALAEQTWPDHRWGVGRRLLLAAVTLVFWRGYLNFPLSDFWALGAVLLALIAIGRVDRPGWMFVAGLSAAVALNMRPAYLLLAPILALLVAFAWWRGRGAPHAGWPKRGIGVALLVTGFALVSLPQSLGAHRHFDTWSFVPGAAGGLQALQFTEGLRMQRYETYVGHEQASPQMIYIDPTGARILRERPNGQVKDGGEYLGVIASHPLQMAGVFGRHIVNGLDARYSTPYVEKIDTGGGRWIRLLGFLLVFVALARVVWPQARRALGAARWRYPAALLAAGATALASAVETRFLLPAYLLSYVLALAPGWPPLLDPAQGGWRRYRAPAVVAVGLVVFFAVVLHIVGVATDHLQFGYDKAPA
jgi:hypothetical protein